VAAAWPHLASDGRYLRFAARLALETVAADSWQARAVAEPDAATALGALLALAAVGGRHGQRRAVRRARPVPARDVVVCENSADVEPR